MESEVIKLLKSPEVKAFGGLVALAIVIAVGSIVYRNYITNKVLTQQSQINTRLKSSALSLLPLSSRQLSKQKPHKYLHNEQNKFNSNPRPGSSR